MSDGNQKLRRDLRAAAINAAMAAAIPGKVAAHQLNQENRAIDAKYEAQARQEAIDKEMAKIQAEVRFEKAAEAMTKAIPGKVAAHQLNQENRAIDAKYEAQARQEAIDKEMAKIQAEVRFEKAAEAMTKAIPGKVAAHQLNQENRAIDAKYEAQATLDIMGGCAEMQTLDSLAKEFGVGVDAIMAQYNAAAPQTKLDGVVVAAGCAQAQGAAR
ncbi:MAG: hypothetical protein AB8U72_03825 [Anaplasma ovis]